MKLEKKKRLMINQFPKRTKAKIAKSVIEHLESLAEEMPKTEHLQYDFGLCYLIYKYGLEHSAMRVNKILESIALLHDLVQVLFPEVMEHKPSHITDKGSYWYDTDLKGCKKRIEIMKTVLKEL